MDKFTATNVLNKRHTADRMARINVRVALTEKQLDAICRNGGTTLDALTRDIRTADAKALAAARKHLTGKTPRSADESNHLATLAAKQLADDQRARAIKEANAQRGIKGMLARALVAVS